MRPHLSSPSSPSVARITLTARTRPDSGRPGRWRGRWTALVGLAVALGAAAPAAAADGGSVPGRVTVEPVVACLLVGGSYDFGSQPFATPGAAPVAHRSSTLAGLTSCGSHGQDLFVRGTDAAGDGVPAAAWALDPAARSGSCALDRYGLGVALPGLPGQALSLLDAPFASILPGVAVDVAADLYLPCSGSTGGGQTMTFSVIYTAVVGAAPAPPATRTLTVARDLNGAGRVTSDPIGIDCFQPCAASFPEGTVVTLTATASPDSAFSGWSGGGCSGTGTCTVTMSADTTVTGRFGLAVPMLLTIVKAGDGSGTVMSDPARIACGLQCSATFGATTLVSLTALAEPGSVFSGWSGGSCSGTGACTFRIGEPSTVGATFSRVTAAVNVTPTTVGFGSVAIGSVSGSTVTVTNAGTSPLTISDVSINGADSGPFTASGGCVGTLDPGSSCGITVWFAPVTQGFSTATLTIVSDVDGSPSTHHVAVTGTGVAA